MKRRHLQCGLAAGGITGIVLAMLVGCANGGGGGTTNVSPNIVGASVTTPGGNLVLSQAALVTVSASVVQGTGTVQAVTADLAAIGGPSAQPMVLNAATNIWSAVLTVVPTVAGNRQVAITVLDSNNLSDQATATITVVNPGDNTGNQPPQLTNAQATGPLLANVLSNLNISVQATDPDGTVAGVTANLSAIGGPNNQLLTQSLTNRSLWTFSGTLIPSTAGTQTILLQAADNQGATGTTTVSIDVNNSAP